MANLTQLRMLEDIDGFILVDKPAGIAFSSVVKAVKRKFNLVKVGHGGSLDAMASGLFIMLVNDANKFVDRVMGADREYEGVMRLGTRTDTCDIHGRVVPQTASECGDLSAAVAQFRGDVFQVEPRYCSVRKEGTAEYEVADTGEHAQFMAHVYRFTLGDRAGDSLPFSLSATKGVIVRALVGDFGDAIGCGAVLESLRRTRIGKFRVEDAIPFDKLLSTDIGDFAECVMPLSKALL